MMWGWFLPASLLGVIMILVIRSMRDIGQWWGIPLLLGGLLSLAVLGVVSAGRADLIRDTLADFAQMGTPFYRAFEIALLGILVAATRLAFFHAFPEPEPGDIAPTAQFSGIPAPPPVPPLGSGPDDEEGPPSGIFG
jgi:hypothetical protein